MNKSRPQEVQIKCKSHCIASPLIYIFNHQMVAYPNSISYS